MKRTFKLGSTEMVIDVKELVLEALADYRVSVGTLRSEPTQIYYGPRGGRYKDAAHKIPFRKADAGKVKEAEKESGGFKSQKQVNDEAREWNKWFDGIEAREKKKYANASEKEHEEMITKYHEMQKKLDKRGKGYGPDGDRSEKWSRLQALMSAHVGLSMDKRTERQKRERREKKASKRIRG